MRAAVQNSSPKDAILLLIVHKQLLCQWYLKQFNLLLCNKFAILFMCNSNCRTSALIALLYAYMPHVKRQRRPRGLSLGLASAVAVFSSIFQAEQCVVHLNLPAFVKLATDPSPVAPIGPLPAAALNVHVFSHLPFFFVFKMYAENTNRVMKW